MSILSGFFKTKKYRKASDGYKLESLWTSSQTVEMNDGNTAETNLGAIKGITSSLASTSSNYALSASAGKDLQDQVSTLNTNLTDKLLPTSFSYATDLTDSVVEIDSLSKLSEKYQFIGIQMVQNINGDEFIYRDIAFMPLPAFCTTNFKYHIRATRSTVTEELWTDVFYVDDTHLRLTLSDGARGYVVIVRLFN